MKIVAFADTHGMHERISEMPDGDVLICAGDCCNSGSYEDVLWFLGWFSQFPHKHKILVAGNHDMWFEHADKDFAKDYCLSPYGVTYLQDESVVIDGVSFYGSPWQPEFNNWAFNLPRGEALYNKWASIPANTNVLITHGPPFGILDTTSVLGKHLGCADLLARIRCLDISHCIFGHIHGGYGNACYEGKQFFNVSVLDELYNIVHPVTEIVL